jgi:hypothetical protein
MEKPANYRGGVQDSFESAAIRHRLSRQSTRHEQKIAALPPVFLCMAAACDYTETNKVETRGAVQPVVRMRRFIEAHLAPVSVPKAEKFPVAPRGCHWAGLK